MLSRTMVFFDAVGTLIRPEPGAIEVYGGAAHRYGLTLSTEEWGQRFRAALATHFAPDDGQADRWATDEMLEARRWRAIIGEVFVELPAAHDELFQTLWQHFADPQHWRVDGDAESVFWALRERGCQIGIASNFDRRLEAICQDWPTLRSVDRIFHSAALQTRKPGRLFYERIAERVGRLPADLVMVGDDWESDYQAARRVGWRAFHVDVQRRRLELPSGQNTPSLSRLTELIARLDSTGNSDGDDIR